MNIKSIVFLVSSWCCITVCLIAAFYSAHAWRHWWSWPLTLWCLTCAIWMMIDSTKIFRKLRSQLKTGGPQ